MGHPKHSIGEARDERRPRQHRASLTCDSCGEALRQPTAGLPFCQDCVLAFGDSPNGED